MYLGSTLRAGGDNSHRRQRPVIFGCYLGLPAADRAWSDLPQPDRLKEQIMIEQETNFPRVERTWRGWPTDLGQTATAVIERTRQVWVSRRNDFILPDAAGANSASFVHPLFTLIMDARSSSARRARRLRARSRRRVVGRFSA